MSLATRCSACGTVFRVVQDQLKVAEGWVRCGRCDEVFNGLEGLFDLRRDEPSETPAPPGERLPELVARDMPAAAAADEPPVPDPGDAQVPGLRRSEDRSTPAERIDERDRLDFPDAHFDTALLGDDSAPTTDAGTDSDADSDADADVQAPPGFMRSAQRGARWRHPKVRAALALAALALLLTLAVQAGHHFRDTLAARWPATQPLLRAWCGAVGCAIEAPRRIDDVAVQSSALTRADAPAEAFTLSVALRNRGSLTLALPSIDLSLTDAAGQLVARRVLSPRDFGVRSTLLAPGAEATLQSVLTAGGARVTGYTVELFYP